jgi:hypothetical protein
VDDSDDWEQTCERLTTRFGPANPDIRFVYEKAERRSPAAARNQLLDRITSDVVFFFDDDSLMFPDCAEQIMKVYEADTRRRVACVGAVLTPEVPDAPRAVDQPPAPSRWRLGHHFFDIERVWVPYDECYPDHPIPSELNGLNVSSIRLVNGMRMTFRRDAVAAVRFEEGIAPYGFPEDLDVVYRVSRNGAVIQANDARMHHLTAAGGRWPRQVFAQFMAFNTIILHGLYSTDRRRSGRRLRWMFLKYAAINTAADLIRRRWSLPKVRAQIFGLRHVGRFMAMDEAAIRERYPQIQRELFPSLPGR